MDTQVTAYYESPLITTSYPQMPLTDTALRNVKPGLKPRKLFDGGGLFVILNPSGSRWWRIKYRFGGKEKLLSLGVYPDVSLKEARQRRDECRQTLASGLNSPWCK